MAKKIYDITETTIARFIREGRGRGYLENYLPWLRVQDVPSKGRSHRPFGWTAGRVHELLSDGEYQTFVLADWYDCVIDILEQFLLDRYETFRIALQMGIRPPLTRDGTPYPLTTDFLFKVRRGDQEIFIARSCKTREDLDDRRVREIFEIERRYWAARGVHWAYVIKGDIDPVLFRNIDYVRGYTSLQHVIEPYPGCFDELAFLIPELLGKAPDIPLVEWCRSLDARFDIPEHTALKGMRHLIAIKRITTDMRAPMSLERRVTSAFQLASKTSRTL